MRKITFVLILSLFVLASMLSTGYCSTKIVSYGFEDWTGDADSTPGYIFGTDAPSYWAYHEGNTGVVSSCQGRKAYEGSKFWRRQFGTNFNDPCIGKTYNNPEAENSHNNIGLGDTVYPKSGNKGVYLPSAIKSNVLFFRTRVRFPNMSDGCWPGMKFARVYGTGGGQTILGVDRGGWIWILTATSSYADDTTVAKLVDGKWHSISFSVKIVNSNKLLLRVWVDDWNAVGSPTLEGTAAENNFGTSFKHLVLLSNFGACDPNDVAVELDNIEIWDGMPSANNPPSNDPPSNDPPSNDPPNNDPPDQAEIPDPPIGLRIVVD